MPCGFCFIHGKSTQKGVNQRTKDVAQTQQQRPESPAVTLTWHTCKYKLHTFHHKSGEVYVLCIYTHARRELPQVTQVFAVVFV